MRVLSYSAGFPPHTADMSVRLYESIVNPGSFYSLHASIRDDSRIRVLVPRTGLNDWGKNLDEELARIAAPPRTFLSEAELDSFLDYEEMEAATNLKVGAFIAHAPTDMADYIRTQHGIWCGGEFWALLETMLSPYPRRARQN